MISRLLFKDHEGFGLMGMILIIFIFSLVTVTVVMTLGVPAATRQSVETANKAELLDIAIAKYVFNHGGVGGTNPTSLDHLATTDGGAACALDNNSSNTTYGTLQGWCGPYINLAIFQENLNDYKTDGWGTAFNYTSVTGVLKSCGPDRTCGNADDITY